MKASNKILSAIMALALLVFATGCGINGKTHTSSTARAHKHFWQYHGGR